MVRECAPNDGRVISNFIVQALQNEPITVYGNGQQTRSFCYVDDLIDGLVRLMATQRRCYRPDQPRQPGGVHDARACRTRHRTDRKPIEDQIYLPLPADDPRQRQPDIGLAMRDLGWKPKVQLRDGLARTIAYFEDLLSSDGSQAVAAE